MKLKLVLDFDGVLFNSAFEAYSVCNHQARSGTGLRQDVNFNEFMECRSFVTDAWQYNRLYSVDRYMRNFSDLPNIVPDEQDWLFAENFFAARAEIMEDPEWPKVMSPYDFFFLIRPLLIEHSKSFAILSTRNVKSIRQTMKFFGADTVEVFGQEDIRRHGSKIKVAEDQGWLNPGEHLVVYIDDMNAHLEPFSGRIHLPLHASWGYDQQKSESLNPDQIFLILNSLIKLA